MILFIPEHVPLILSGRKTQTRRLGKPRWIVGAVHQAKTKLFGAAPFAHLRIVEVRQEPLGAITEADAILEGCESVAEYRRVWEKINRVWTPGQRVNVVTFELAPAGEAEA